MGKLLVAALLAAALLAAVFMIDFAAAVGSGWPVAAVLAVGFALLGWLLYADRRTGRSIEANVADAVRRRDRLLGRRPS